MYVFKSFNIFFVLLKYVFSISSSFCFDELYFVHNSEYLDTYSFSIDLYSLNIFVAEFIFLCKLLSSFLYFLISLSIDINNTSDDTILFNIFTITNDINAPNIITKNTIDENNRIIVLIPHGSQYEELCSSVL